MKRNLENDTKLKVVAAKKFVGTLVTILAISLATTGCGFNFGSHKDDTKITTEITTEDDSIDIDETEKEETEDQEEEEETSEESIKEDKNDEETKDESEEDKFEVPNIGNYKGHSIVDALALAGYDSSKAYREELAIYFNIENYTGTAEQNELLLKYLKDYAKSLGNNESNNNNNNQNNNNNNNNSNNNNNNENNNNNNNQNNNNNNNGGNNGGGSGNGGSGNGGNGEEQKPQPHTHNYVLTDTKVVTNNNGTHKVVKTYTCPDDGQTRRETSTESCNYGSWKSISDTKESRKCADCGYTQTRDKTPEHTHNYTNPVITYEDLGNGTHKVVTTKTCSCGDTSVSYVTESCNYSYTYKDQTSDTAKCTKCEDTKTVAHDLTKTGVTSSSTSGKHNEVYSCSNCNHTDIYKEVDCTPGSTLYYTSDKLYEYYLCTECGDEVNKQAHSHSYGAWTKVDDSTEKRTCACGSEETQSHTFGAPVYAADGLSYTETCSSCGYERTTAVQHTHSYTAGDKQYVGSADVCYKITYTCSCGDTYTTDYTHPGFTQSSTAGSGDVCYTKYDVCTDPNCGYSKNYQDVAHNYELSESDPEEDYDIYECSECHKQQSRTR